MNQLIDNDCFKAAVNELLNSVLKKTCFNLYCLGFETDVALDKHLCETVLTPSPCLFSMQTFTRHVLNKDSLNPDILLSRVVYHGCIHLLCCRDGKSLNPERAWREIQSRGLVTAIDVDVPGYEWHIFDQLLDSGALQVFALSI